MKESKKQKKQKQNEGTFIKGQNYIKMIEMMEMRVNNKKKYNTKKRGIFNHNTK